MDEFSVGDRVKHYGMIGSIAKIDAKSKMPYYFVQSLGTFQGWCNTSELTLRAKAGDCLLKIGDQVQFWLDSTFYFGSVVSIWRPTPYSFMCEIKGVQRFSIDDEVLAHYLNLAQLEAIG